MPYADWQEDDGIDWQEEQDQMSEASEEDFTRWAERYDELNGAPDSEEDR